MMSKERELLKRLAEGDNRGDFFISLELIKEVEAILAQPAPFKPDWANYRQGVEDAKREPIDTRRITLKMFSEGVTQPEPFMFKDRKLTGSLIAHDEMYKRGYARAEFDLKREPLSDESICEILLKKEWKGFVDLVRIIEKAHGIGVDDE